MKPLALLTVTISLLAGAYATHARDYRFIFAPFDARFDPDLAQNRTTAAAALRLLHDLAGAGSIRFVLVGERQPACPATGARCGAERLGGDEGLVRQRVEAVAAELMAQSSNPRLMEQLEWQDISPVGGAAHVEGLSLRLRVFAGDPRGDPRADLCPYQVQISDPRLPPLISSGNDTVEWVPVTGLGSIVISAQGAVRVVAGATPAGADFLTAIEMLPGGPVRLKSGVSEARWRAAQMTWNAGAADVRIDFATRKGTLAAVNTDPRTRSRGIGDVVQDWTALPSNAAGTARACDLHFVLSRPQGP